jgi:hypothetical protein
MVIRYRRLFGTPKRPGNNHSTLYYIQSKERILKAVRSASHN